MDKRRQGYSRSSRLRSRSRSCSCSRSRSPSRHRSRTRSNSPSPRKNPSRSRKSDSRRSQREESSPSRFVCINGLALATSFNTLQTAISDRIGPSVFIQFLDQPGATSTKALVEFENGNLVRKCIRRMDETKFNGRVIGVNEVSDVESFLREHSIGNHPGEKTTERYSPPEIHEPERKTTAAEPTFSGLLDRWAQEAAGYDATAETRQKQSEPAIRNSIPKQPTAKDMVGTNEAQWLYSGHMEHADEPEEEPRLRPDDPRVQQLQAKLWSNIWKTRLSKKDGAGTSQTSVSTCTMADMGKQMEMAMERESSLQEVSSVETDVKTGVLHIRRALETMRKSEASRMAFQSPALILGQMNDELSRWREMYFSGKITGAGFEGIGKTSKGLVDGNKMGVSWQLEDILTGTAVPVESMFLRSSPGLPSEISGLSMVPPGYAAPPGSQWFMIGRALPRFSPIAAIRRDALPPLVDVSWTKAKLALSELSHLASVGVLSRCIRAIRIGGYVDLDWFVVNNSLHPASTTMGDPGLSFANWYRCFEFVIKISQTIEAPSEYLSSLNAYKTIIGLWWRLVASTDIQAGRLHWLPFYELIDKSWRIYAARSPEYRCKLHIFDAWWVCHQMNLVSQKWNFALPPYDPNGVPNLRDVVLHCAEMERRPCPVESAEAYCVQNFDVAMDACLVCGDPEHKVAENGRAVPKFCPFTSRRIDWCTAYYDGICDSEDCQKCRRHCCAHCGNPGQLVRTCPNCKNLVV